MDGHSSLAGSAGAWANAAAHDPDLDAACFALERADPSLSARRTLTRAQIVFALALAAALGVAGWWAPGVLLAALHAAAFLGFAAIALSRLFAAAAGLASPLGLRAPLADIQADAPIYSILCPLYREASIVPELIAALSRLHYPHDRLDVILVLEADDAETIAAALASGLPPWITLALVPPGGPRTKPKALNYALPRARGDYLVIYDAEDRPHPDQLAAALGAFEKGGPRLGCVQAPLRIDNAGASWIARQFATEYAIQFEALIPALVRCGLPFALGGTSNHFRMAALRGVGGWDAFNVTEDADLGYRLARQGWRIGAIAPPTYEEAPARFPCWLRQRTRWIKGYLQTWLVLMRNPARTYQELGAAGFFSMQLMLGGAIMAALLHGPLALWLLAGAFAPGIGAGALDLGLAALGYCGAAYGALVTAALCRDLSLARAALTMPFYWPLATLAGLRALVELLLRPHYWAKTTHGHSPRRPILCPPSSPSRSPASSPARPFTALGPGGPRGRLTR